MGFADRGTRLFGEAVRIALDTTVEINPENAEHPTEWYPSELSKDAVLCLIDREIAVLVARTEDWRRARKLVAAAPNGGDPR